MGLKRRNERKFRSWESLPNGGRRYWRDFPRRSGGKARCLKEVDRNEKTERFWQEIYEVGGKLVQIHEKFPVDKGHQTV